MREFLHPQGVRVRVRQGSFPIDSSLLGREGIVFRLDPYRLGRYVVLLDGESETREFAEDEMERAG